MTSKNSAISKIKNVPLTEQARTAILDAIMQKRFDTRLPSEEALADMLNVSRTTIRTALQSLEQDGIITRKRAIGTTINSHVRPSALALQRMVGFDSLLRENGYEVEVTVDWSREPVGEPLAETFSLDPKQDSLIARKSYFADGALVISIRDAVPWENLRDQDFKSKVTPSIFEFSAEHWKEPIDHIVVEMLPVVKQSEETTDLGIEVGTAFMQLHERFYAGNGELLAASLVDVNAHFIRFEIFRRR